jgi:anti-sigma B factor antagonist
MALAIEPAEHGTTTLLVLRGELDIATSPQLRDELVRVIGDGRRIVVDLEGLDFIDSVGLGILVSGLKRARSDGGDLELVCANRVILQPLELTGLDQTFTMHARREEALGRNS